jgi:membrane-associated phospholipid phosphatase
MAVTFRPSAQAQAPHSSHQFAPVDLLLLGYLAIATAVAVHRAAAAPACWWVAGGNLLMAGLVVLLARPGLGRFGRSLHEIYPLFLLIGLYGQLDILNGPSVGVHDATVQTWELALFGAQISREWWQIAPSVRWSEVLHAAYFSYYIVVPSPAFYFLFRGDLPAVRRFVLTVMSAFIVCYIVFLFFPVAGPYYAFPRPAAWFVDNGPARLVYAILARGSSHGAAFPSSHVAGTVAAAFAAARGSRRLGWVLLLPTVLLTIGVVYCQMHYAVDALAGLVVGVAVSGVVARLAVLTGEPRRNGNGGSI